MSRFILVLITCSFLLEAPGQTRPSSPEQISESYRVRTQLAQSSLLKHYPVRSIGPVVMGGRIADLEINQENVHEYYVGYASGGVFYTEDNGITFKPIFDNQGALGVGDMALAPSNENILYVGTGEKNSSRSSYAGSGVYKTTDKGEHWEHLGLTEIHHTSRIIVHPDNPDIVWVAALGALYSHNPGRGIYKSQDGGLNWEKKLFINDSTGIVDLLINPQNPDQLWATAWERRRSAWNFKGHGMGSGMYRSDDGGETWKALNNFPSSEWTGRIGVDICLSQPNTLYALVDNQKGLKQTKEKEAGQLQPADFVSMSISDFQALDSSRLNHYLREHEFPKKYQSELVKQEVRNGKYLPKDLAEYLGDANKELLEAKVTGAELYRSNDYGDTWKKVNSYHLDGVYNTYGYYFGEVRVAPDNPEVVYIFGVPLLITEDGGETYHRIDSVGNVHVDHQALWINPENPKHLLLGNDGGLYVSYSAGAQWLHLNSAAVGQFYTVNVDMESPYHVYGGLQDNGVYAGSSKSVPNKSKHWEKLLGGDGMFVAVDPRNSQLVYAGYQFGNYFKIDRTTNDQHKITPKHDIGEDRLRFNWRAPLVLSKHHPDILYLGAQKLFRSMDKGDSWLALSPDLTKNLPQGNVPYSTICSLEESPLKFGWIYVGTDDGNIQFTKSAGDKWQLISQNLPELWVSSIHASSHQASTVFVSLNGYREDDYRTYIYRSDDNGQNWVSLKGNLGEVVVNAIRQDPVNPEIIYLGTDHGAYISLDAGQKWNLINNIPNVSVYDLLVHPRENELILATHGRSIYIMDVEPLQELDVETDASLVAFKPAKVVYSDTWGESKYPWSEPNLPSMSFMYYLGTSSGEVDLTITDVNGKKLAQLKGPGEPGFHLVPWDLQLSKKGKKPSYIEPGAYQTSFSSGGTTVSLPLEIEEPAAK